MFQDKVMGTKTNRVESWDFGPLLFTGIEE